VFFIKNKRTTPIFIIKLSKLIRRVPQTQSKRHLIQEQLSKHSSGFKGEQSLDYFYRYLPKDQIHYLHGIRILHDGYYFQMDTILITPSFIIILEIKHLAGHLYFDDRFSQLIRTFEGRRESFSNPIEQVKRQSYHLTKILNQYKFNSVPIESLVIMTHPSAIIEASPLYKEATEKVIKSSSLQQKFLNLSQKYPLEILEQKQIKKLTKLLTKLNSAYNPDVCELFQINKNELVNGVFCPICDFSIMKYIWGNWRCLTCKTSSKTAHITALQDYAYLISTKITNRESMSYLNLESSNQTNHLLRSLNLPYTGNRKSRHYHLDSLLEKEH
jgi:Nuclease-related domain